MGSHMFCSILAGDGVLLALNLLTGRDYYYDLAVLLTGITGLLSMIPCLWFYRRDQARREYGGLISSPPGISINLKEAVLLLGMGAALSQIGNVVAGVLQIVFDATEYQDMVSGITGDKSLLFLIFWMGIVAPVAEEMVFRWLIYLRIRDNLGIWASAVLSAALFGLYHGNLVQGIYAALLGVFIAYFLEMSGNLFSCILLHIGANVWSLLISEYGQAIIRSLGQGYLWVYVILFILFIKGFIYFHNKGKSRGYRAV